MIFWVAKQVILSVTLIAVIHYIYTFFKNNLTIPQVKDLIHKPQQQYNEIYSKIKTKKKENNESMKEELKKYLAEIQQQPTTEEKEPILSVGSNFNNNFNNAYQTL